MGIREGAMVFKDFVYKIFIIIGDYHGGVLGNINCIGCAIVGGGEYGKRGYVIGREYREIT